MAAKGPERVRRLWAAPPAGPLHLIFYFSSASRADALVLYVRYTETKIDLTMEAWKVEWEMIEDKAGNGKPKLSVSATCE